MKKGLVTLISTGLVALIIAIGPLGSAQSSSAVTGSTEIVIKNPISVNNVGGGGIGGY